MSLEIPDRLLNILDRVVLKSMSANILYRVTVAEPQVPVLDDINRLILGP